MTKKTIQIKVPVTFAQLYAAYKAKYTSVENLSELAKVMKLGCGATLALYSGKPPFSRGKRMRDFSPKMKTKVLKFFSRTLEIDLEDKDITWLSPDYVNSKGVDFKHIQEYD